MPDQLCENAGLLQLLRFLLQPYFEQASNGNDGVGKRMLNTIVSSQQACE